MMTVALLAAAAGVILGAAAILWVQHLRERRARGLGAGRGAQSTAGPEVHRATARVLHRANAVTRILRGGASPLDPARSARAARELRALLGVDAVALVDIRRSPVSVSLDGRAPAAAGHAAQPTSRAALKSAAQRVALAVRDSGRTHEDPGVPNEQAPAAVGVPITTSRGIAAVLVVFAQIISPSLVRATKAVAESCGIAFDLSDLDDARVQLDDAELRALRAQISPHFIYNALTAIASLIHTAPERARELVLEFADFTRYSFRKQGDFTTLAEELRSIHSYLELERARFEDRLKVTLRIAPETLATEIQFLSVQPLVENAVNHGLRASDAGAVRIVAVDAATHTEITVEDDGAGMDPESLRTLLTSASEGTHIGLRNVDMRLRHLYGASGGLVVETNTGAGTLVRMRIPKSQPTHELDTSRAAAPTLGFTHPDSAPPNPFHQDPELPE